MRRGTYLLLCLRGVGVKQIQGRELSLAIRVLFSCPLFLVKNPGIEVMEYKHSPDESGDDLGGGILQERGQC